MMAVRGRQLSEGRRIWIDREGKPFDVRAALAPCNGSDVLTRRSEAMLAGAFVEPPRRRWYVLRIASSREIPVDNLLEAGGVERWLPEMEITRKRRGGRQHQQLSSFMVPIWPGYIFVRVVDTARSWAALARLDGVVAVLGTAERPAVIDDDKLLKLKVRLEHDEEARDLLAGSLKPGHGVRITEGSFASFEGIVEKLIGFDRVKVEVDVFGRKCLVDLDLAKVSKIG